MRKGFTLLLLLVSAVAQSQSSRIDSLSLLLSKHSHDSLELDVLRELSTEFLRIDLKKAKHYAFQQIVLANELNTVNGLSSAYSLLVTILQRNGQPDSAQFYLSKHKALISKYPKKLIWVSNFTTSAGLFYKNQGNFIEALPYLLEAIGLNASGDKTRLAGDLLNVGNIYNRLGDLKNASSYHLKSLVLFEEVGNERGQSFCLQGLGNDFLLLRQFAVAEKYIFQAVKIKEELGDKRGVLTAWQSLGELYQQMNKPELSMHYSNMALVRAREMKLLKEELAILFNIAKVSNLAHKSDVARAHFNEALVLSRQLGDSLFASKIETQLALIKPDPNRAISEEQTIKQTIKISEEMGDKSGKAETQNKLAEWYATHDQFEQAFEHLKLSHQLNDSIRGAEVIMRLKSLEEEYNKDKTAREIDLLKKDQELQALALSRQRVILLAVIGTFIFLFALTLLLVNRYRVLNKAKRIIEVERVRSSIARDLHDDMGSSLSSIKILSQVALQNNSPIDNLEKIRDKATLLLDSMSDIVWSINTTNDNAIDLISRMKEFCSEILEPKNIRFQFSGQLSNKHWKPTLDEKRNVFLFFKEAINNIAKYSEASEVKIEVSEPSGGFQMSINDNGVGFDATLDSSGNGIHNMKDRAERMSGTFILSTKSGIGTEIQLTLPKNESKS